MSARPSAPRGRASSASDDYTVRIWDAASGNEIKEAQTNYKTAIIIAAASSALVGRLAEAQTAMARLRELDPALRITNVRNWAPLRRPEDLARLKNGLQKAGLPE
jgi:hypothetical protein